MKPIQAYQANDGTLYETESEAVFHDNRIEWESRVNKFAQTDLCPYKTGAHRGMVTNIIIGWEMFKAKELT